MLREIIKIDEEKCDGCGKCVPSCHEGALQIIEGKCRLISELFCDGLGACIGECPQNAITIELREAEEYNEEKVMLELVKQPESVLKAHLKHLFEHQAMDYYNIALKFLLDNSIKNPFDPNLVVLEKEKGSCPSTNMIMLDTLESKKKVINENEYALEQWPIQLHLVNPNAGFLKDKELVILSTCSPVAYPNTFRDYIQGKAIVLACPKLDYTEPYPEKLSQIIKYSNTKNVTVVRMEVPCCGGLSKIAQIGALNSEQSGITVEEHIISLDGNLINKKVIFNT